MTREDSWPALSGEPTLAAELARRGVSRRDFMRYCAMLAALLALPADHVPRIAEALQAQSVQRPPVLYYEFQDCAGDSEALLRADNPTVGEIVLDKLSLNYHETIMAPSGSQALADAADTIKAGGYILMVEGAIPTKDNGVYCCIGGRTALDLLKEAAKGAAAIVAVGNCACFGNIPAAYPNPTGAVGVRDVVSGAPVVNLAGCPVNATNLAAFVAHYVTYKSLPQLDGLGRPTFAYGVRIHDACERRAHFDAGEYVEQFGDEGHRNGWCLYKMGCKGPATFHNCPVVRYNERTNWPIGAGHPCIGCAEVGFFDRMTPFYQRLPNVPGFGVEINAEKVALGLVGATVVGIAAHAVGSAVRKRPSGEPSRAIDREEAPSQASESGGQGGETPAAPEAAGAQGGEKKEGGE